MACLKFKSLNVPNFIKDTSQLQMVYTADTTTLENSLEVFFKMLDIPWPCDPDISILITFAPKMKIYVYRKTCTWMVMIAVSVIAKIWRQLKCASTGEQINKLWYMHVIEFYSANKRITWYTHNMNESYYYAEWKEHRKTFWSNGYIHYLDCEDGFRPYTWL